MTQYRQPFWFNQAIKTIGPLLLPPLTKNIKTDVVIIGGGFTGLWSAISIKQFSPQTNVVIIEKDHCGQGASGRNGGCMLTFSAKYSSLAKLYGHDEALKLIDASEQAVYQIRDFCLQHNIDAEIRIDGCMYSATNLAQQKTLNKLLANLTQHNVKGWHKMGDPSLLSGSAHNIMAIKHAAAGSLQPAKLVLGLAKQALALGVKIYQNTPMTKLVRESPVRVVTPHAEIQAKQCILATNAWSPSLIKELKNSVMLVSSDMLITKPMPEQLKAIGLNHGATVCDSRIFVHYYRTTPDGRLMLGKGGNYLPWNNNMSLRFEQESRYKTMLQKSFKQFFPDLPLAFEPTWTGASDRSPTGLPFFGHLVKSPHIFYGLGYSGNGVVQSYMGGKILASLVLGLDNSWRRSPLIADTMKTFLAEPFRYLGAQLVQSAIQRKEAKEDLTQKPYWFDKQFAKLAASAAKADNKS